jgi:hypothetical protein
MGQVWPHSRQDRCVAYPNRVGVFAVAADISAVFTGEAFLLIYPGGLTAPGRTWHLSRDDLAASNSGVSGRTINVMVAGASSGRSLHPSG